VASYLLVRMRGNRAGDWRISDVEALSAECSVIPVRVGMPPKIVLNR